MNEFLASLDWAAIISVIWTVVLLPIITTIGKKINDKFFPFNIVLDTKKNAVRFIDDVITRAHGCNPVHNIVVNLLDEIMKPDPEIIPIV